MGPSEMSLKCNFTTFYVLLFGKIFEKSSNFSETAPFYWDIFVWDHQ